VSPVLAKSPRDIPSA
jgi:hypothetical protein